MSAREDRWDHGVTVPLTAHQREYVARKVLQSLASARRNRRRIADKYPQHETATGPMDQAIHTLHDLGRKLGLTAKDLES